MTPEEKETFVQLHGWHFGPINFFNFGDCDRVWMKETRYGWQNGYGVYQNIDELLNKEFGIK